MLLVCKRKLGIVFLSEAGYCCSRRLVRERRETECLRVEALIIVLEEKAGAFYSEFIPGLTI